MIRRKTLIISLCTISVLFIIVLILISNKDDGLKKIKFENAITTKETAIKVAIAYIEEHYPEFETIAFDITEDGRYKLTYEAMEIVSDNLWSKLLLSFGKEPDIWYIQTLFTDASGGYIIDGDWIGVYISKKTGELIEIEKN